MVVVLGASIDSYGRLTYVMHRDGDYVALMRLLGKSVAPHDFISSGSDGVIYLVCDTPTAYTTYRGARRSARAFVIVETIGNTYLASTRI